MKTYLHFYAYRANLLNINQKEKCCKQTLQRKMKHTIEFFHMNYEFQDNRTKTVVCTFLNSHIQQSTVVFQVHAEIINENKCFNRFGRRQELVRNKGKA
jgi:hypothetical protein